MKNTSKVKILAVLVTIMMLLGITNAVNAYSAGVSLTSASKLKAGETVSIVVTAKDIDAGEGIQGLTGTLSYDGNIFEELKKSNITTNGDWSVDYASSNKKVIFDNTSKVKENTAIATINLTVKSGVTAEQAVVGLNTVTVSGGLVSAGGTGTINVANASVTVYAEKDSTSQVDNTITNTPATTTNTAQQTANTTGTTVKSTSNTANTAKTNTIAKSTTTASKLPKTGASTIVISTVAVVAIVGIIFYIRYKNLKKYVK